MSPEKYWLEDKLHSFCSGPFFRVDLEKNIGSVVSSTVVSTKSLHVITPAVNQNSKTKTKHWLEVTLEKI